MINQRLSVHSKSSCSRGRRRRRQVRWPQYALPLRRAALLTGFFSESPPCRYGWFERAFGGWRPLAGKTGRSEWQHSQRRKKRALGPSRRRAVSSLFFETHNGMKLGVRWTCLLAFGSGVGDLKALWMQQSEWLTKPWPIIIIVIIIVCDAWKKEEGDETARKKMESYTAVIFFDSAFLAIFWREKGEIMWYLEVKKVWCGQGAIFQRSCARLAKKIKECS